VMEPDSEETRTIFELGARCLDRWREWIMKGGEIADVAVKSRLVSFSLLE
jgi:hypothetical protein